MGDAVARLRVALIGYGFMGAAHAQAWRTAPAFFAALPVRPELAVVCGRDGPAAKRLADRFGVRHVVTSWQEAVNREDIDVVDVCTPGDTHAAIAIAALEAGKHVLCEKPLATSLDDAARMAEASREAALDGIATMVGYSYRRVPAIALARQLVAEGRLGEVRHVRVQYLQDWLADPAVPHSWRLDAASAGHGALGDIGSHAIDLAQFLSGAAITEVSALLKTFVPTRNDPQGEPRAVTVDDAAAFLAHFDNGAVGTFEATRMATGSKNAIRLAVEGTDGALMFDFEEMNILRLYQTADGTTAGFRRIVVTEPEHPYIAAWWPPGHGLGYEHTFTHQIAEFVDAIGTGKAASPTFEDGLGVELVLEAVARSAAAKRWVEVE